MEKSILIDKARKQETSRKMPLLDWLNKSQALKATASAPFRLLDEVPELSYGDETSDNMLIQGDNLKDSRIVVVEYKGDICLEVKIQNKSKRLARFGPARAQTRESS